MEGGKTMTYMIARHRVADFSQWKSVFDSHSAAQQEAGLNVKQVLRNIDDPDDVFVLFEITDLESARAFVSSSEVPKAKEESGVIGDTEIYFLS